MFHRICRAIILIFVFSGHITPAELPEREPPKSINLNLQLPAAKSESHVSEIVKSVCELLAALAWPSVALGALIASRRSLPTLLAAVIDLIQRTDHVKVLELIDIEADRAGKKAEEILETPQDIPVAERTAADRVGGFVTDVRLSDIQKRMRDLAQEYDETRARMKSGKDRTRAMNAIVARMHTLAILAKPLLPIFADGAEPGERLAAISILELSPSLDYVPWLVERMGKESPFLLFHTSLAIREIALKYREFAEPGLRVAVSRCLQTLDRFELESGKPADHNTRAVLKSTMNLLGETAAARHQAGR